MFCKKCGTKNEADMVFCQNCGESIKEAPIANTIKIYANVVFGLTVFIGIVIVISGIIFGVFYTENGIPVIIGLIVGAWKIVLGYILRAFVYGYGIIVNYCEKRDD